MNDVIYWLWLSTSPRIGPRAITSLLKYYGCLLYTSDAADE